MNLKRRRSMSGRTDKARIIGMLGLVFRRLADVLLEM
jgi:hypothetical protein